MSAEGRMSAAREAKPSNARRARVAAQLRRGRHAEGRLRAVGSRMLRHESNLYAHRLASTW